MNGVLYTKQLFSLYIIRQLFSSSKRTIHIERDICFCNDKKTLESRDLNPHNCHRAMIEP